MLCASLALIGCPRLDLPTRTLFVNGQERSYELYAPPAALTDSPLPLVIVLHGAGGTGDQVARMTDFHELAQTESYFVAYPDGLRRVWDFDPAGSLNDAAFVDALLDDLIANFPVDVSRVYLVGISNGGFLTHLLACQSNARIAAAAMVISALPVAVATACQPAKPMPVLLMNGTDDPIIPFEADVLEAGPHISIDVLPAQETANFWVSTNALSSEPYLSTLPDLADDGTQTELRFYVEPGSNAEVAAYIIHGGGHTWPGLQRDVAARVLGRTAHDFCATEVIWDFLSRHKRAAAEP